MINSFWNEYRKFKLRFRGATIGKNVFINGHVRVINPINLVVRDGVSLNHGVIITCMQLVFIGTNTHVSPYVQIHTGSLNKERHHNYKPVIIGRNVWIASGSIICHNTIIPNDSTIPALSKVNKHTFI